MKWLAAAFAFSLCTLIGYMKSNKLSSRSNAISQLLHDLRQIGTQLEYTSLPIGELIKRIKTSIPELWEQLSQSLSQGKSTIEAWHETVELCEEDTLLGALEEEEMKVLNDFFSTFGSSDKNSQKQNINTACTQLESIFAEVDKDSKKKQKAFFTVGVLTGIALAILML